MKRPSLPVRVKLDVVIRQEGKCSCGCGNKLGTLKETRFDHDPPLALRARSHGNVGTWRATDESLPDTFIPNANDPAYITAMRVECHDLKTNGKPHTSYGSDKHEIAKMNRLAPRLCESGGQSPCVCGATEIADAIVDCERLTPRPEPRKIRSRGFDKTRTRRMDGTTERRDG